MDEKITISAKTLDEAITKALIELQTTSEHLQYEIVQKENSGFLGIFGAKPCVIHAKVMNNEAEEASNEKEKQKSVEEKHAMVKKEHRALDLKTETFEKKEKSVLKFDETKIKNAAEDFLKQVSGAMGMKISIETSYDPESRELMITMLGDDMGILIGKHGQTLDSLQYLVSLVVNKETEGYLRVKLDTENYRERRKETLELLAKNISYKVKRTKCPISLEPMNPYERRIIHSALQNDRYVITRSEGEDSYRHVVIAPKKDSYGGGRRERYVYRKDRDNQDKNRVDNLVKTVNQEAESTTDTMVHNEN